MSVLSEQALFSPTRTPYNQGLKPFWLETKEGFLLQPKVGKLSLYAFLGSFLLLVVCFGIFLEILASLNKDLVDHKFRMYLTFILVAPALSTLVAFFFRRMLRGLWGEVRFSEKPQTLRIARRGQATTFPIALFRETSLQKTEFTNGEQQWQILFHFHNQSSPEDLAVYFWGFPEEEESRRLAEKLQKRLREEDRNRSSAN
ncbi:MAG: hypothetical protein JJT75_08645 [Opitutales bacterium]|nr:hypothetical protein [Opitutales bacterium]